MARFCFRSFFCPSFSCKLCKVSEEEIVIKKIDAFFLDRRFFLFFSFLSLGIILFIGFNGVLSGALPFWYDPARDFLLAWDNLSKLTLIGPTTGIPGVFYGPYWIWFISLGLLISKDPRFSILLIQTIPYTVILPFLFLRQTGFSKLSLLSLWILFMISAGINYASMPWNPQIAPVFLILVCLLIQRINLVDLNNQQYRYGGILGLLLGLLINVHISFGIVAAVGTAIYVIGNFVHHLIINSKKTVEENLKKEFIFCFITASTFLLTVVPFFLFEIRHNFLQIRTIIATLTSSYAVVGVKGLAPQDILLQFPLKFAHLFSLPLTMAVILFVIFIIVFLIPKNKEKRFTTESIRIFYYTICLLGSAMGIYLLSKNPVWAYHFIGIDVLIMFLSLVLIQRNKLIQILVFVWALYILFSYALTFSSGFHLDVLRLTSLKSEMVNTQIIRDDAGRKDYTVFPYNPAIYSYEYAYLFRWLAHKEVPYDPGQTSKDSDLTYILVTSLSDPKQLDFIEFRANSSHYVTTKTWNRPDGTIILKRELKK